MKMASCLRKFAFRFLASFAVTLCLAVFAESQTYYSPNQQVRIDDLPTVTARSRHASDVLAASAEIVFHDTAVCCGKDSALEDAVAGADPRSLQDASQVSTIQ